MDAEPRPHGSAREVLAIQDRTFVLALFLQAGVALLGFVVAVSAWKAVHRRAELESVRSSFAVFEPNITESAYVREISGEQVIPEPKAVQDLIVQLRRGEIDAEAALGDCGDPGADLVLPLTVGDRKLRDCLRVSLAGFALGKAFWSLLSLSVVSFALSGLVWAAVRRRISLAVVQPLVADIEAGARSRARAELAEQVAHDIRSPLAALAVVEHELASTVSPEIRELTRGAIERIRSIASTLLESHRRESREPVELAPLIAALIEEKRLQLAQAPGVSLVWSPAAEAAGLRAAVVPMELARILSNLVNNAVEACATGAGRVEVSLEPAAAGATIRVSDTGRGIPPDVLAQLGERGVSYGKTGGHGLGVAHAIATVRAWGGDVEIKSQVGRGTSVSVRLPRPKGRAV